MSNRKNERGFTLVELSIVLVIIGLIVGGVLAGQSLIASARLQAEVTQFNKLDTAMNAFYLQYSALPGDTANIGSFAITVVAGDGDGYIGHAGAGGAAADFSVYTNSSTEEESGAASELMQAGLVPGTPVDATGASVSDLASTGGDVILGKLIPGSGIVLFGNKTMVVSGAADKGIGSNWAGYGITAGTSPAVTVSNIYTSLQVSAIDNKLDDGNALSGLVQSRDATTSHDMVTPGVAGCNDTTTGIYAQTTTANQCAFIIRFSH